MPGGNRRQHTISLSDYPLAVRIPSAFIDNIPFVGHDPLIQDMGRLSGLNDLTFLWWSLSLGSCLGGNGTAIGASANIVVIGMAEKRGVHVSFIGLMKVAFPLMLLSIVISTVYLLFWHYLHLMHYVFQVMGPQYRMQIRGGLVALTPTADREIDTMKCKTT